MKKIIFILVFILAVSCLSADGIILWPQVTEAIYNADGQKTMDIEIEKDGLTVTDKCWDTYQVEGCSKRWNIDMGEYQNGPLKNYKFNKAWSGLPVTITIEIYKNDNYWHTVESYQEILILGGKQKTVEFPKWFSLPKNRLGYDFEENKKWPRDWTLPKGKLAIFQGCAKVRQEDIDGVNPWLRYGFTHVYPHAVSKGGVTPPREHLGGLFYDNEWIDMENGKYKDGSESGSWHGEIFLERARDMSIIMPDFEWCGSNMWQSYQYEAFRDIIDKTREAYPDVQVGCWGIGPFSASFRIFDDFDENNQPSGVVNENSALKWRNLYKNPEQKRNSVYSLCHLNFGNPSVYYVNNAKPSQLYAFMQEFECGKILYPNDKNVLSTWIQVEFVDGYPLSSYSFPDTAGNRHIAYLKHQVPASQVYALSLFGHTVMDGLHCWDIGTFYSEDVDEYACFEQGEPAKKITVNGVSDVACNYYVKYYGFYNYHILGMWQASKNKDIIEADTPWIMPEYISDRNNEWRTGDKVFPSFAN
ncbi:MAG: hypothetical protein KBT47_01030, partial [Armatimonadetes bacterium]|nr:hypothetical protein [Candidatus Hippobium faecium]